MEDGAFALFCCPHPRGSWELKSSRRQEFDIHWGKNKIPEGGGGGKCTVFTVYFICSGISLNMCMN